MKSHTHPIGGSTGGAIANIKSATHSHYHDVDASHKHLASTSVGVRSIQCYGSGSGSGGLVKDDGHLSGASDSYITASASTTVDSATVQVRSGNASSTNVSITQDNHAHGLPENTTSNDSNANENRPENFTVIMWKRIA